MIWLERRNWKKSTPPPSSASRCLRTPTGPPPGPPHRSAASRGESAVPGRASCRQGRRRIRPFRRLGCRARRRRGQRTGRCVGELRGNFGNGPNRRAPRASGLAARASRQPAGCSARRGPLSASVVALANALYHGEAWAFALHDALLEDGLPELAKHFSGERHPKGCWGLDWILGKK